VTTDYGNPADWDGEVPAPFVAAITEHLGRLGWTVYDADETSIQVVIPIEATAQQAAAKRGEHLLVWLSGETFFWKIVEPEHGGYHPNPNTLDIYKIHPSAVVASIDHLLRNGEDK
jgi:hypothetical protein